MSLSLYARKIRRTLPFSVEILRGGDFGVEVSFSEREDDLKCIFQQDWWLSVLRQTQGYREVLVHRDGRCIARFPFSLRERLGVSLAGNADWSRLGGPIFSTELDPDQRKTCLDTILDRLPGAAHQHFVLPSSVLAGNGLFETFLKRGFTHSVQINYLRAPENWGVSSEEQAVDRILQGFSRKKRLHVRQAGRQLVVEEIAPSAFVSMYGANLASLSAGSSNRPLASARALLEAAVGRGQARILAARRPSPSSPLQHDAALACVWDDKRYYYWMSTRRAAVDEQGRSPHPDAVKLLAVRALAQAEMLGLIFDADGAVTPGSNHLYGDIFGLSRSTECRHEFRRHTLVSAIYFSRAGQAIKDAVFKSRLRHEAQPAGPAMS